MKKGLFFGSFDPVHNGHLEVASYFIKNTHLSEIIFIVTPQNPFKLPLQDCNFDKRFKAVELATANNPMIKLSDVELKLPAPNYTCDTLEFIRNNNPKRKLKYGLELIKVDQNLVGINTHMANKIVNHALSNNLIKELKNCDVIKPEVFYNKETRFDFMVEKNNKKSFVEVKNVTLFRDKKTAEFPDAITSRGSKHLLTLIDAIKKGYKSYLLFLVQIQNMEKFKIAKDIDTEYYKNYILAKKAGVNFLAYRCKINSKEIFIEKKLKIINE